MVSQFVARPVRKCLGTCLAHFQICNAQQVAQAAINLDKSATAGCGPVAFQCNIGCYQMATRANAWTRAQCQEVCTNGHALCETMDAWLMKG